MTFSKGGAIGQRPHRPAQTVGYNRSDRYKGISPYSSCTQMVGAACPRQMV